MMLRQNPLDECQLQQSLDGGETWTLAFDYSLCIPDWAKSLLETSQDLQQDLWNGATSPIGINPYAPTDTWVTKAGETAAQMEERVQALCFAAREAIDVACSMLIAAYEGEISFVDLAQSVLAVIGGIATALGATVWLAFGVGIAAAALEVYQGMVQGDIDILNDASVRTTLACMFFQAVQSRPVTVAAIQQGFGQTVNCLTSDEQRAYLLVNTLFGIETAAQDVYNGFVDALGDATAAYRAGLLNAQCACPARPWTTNLNLEDWFEHSSPAHTAWGCPPNEIDPVENEGGVLVEDFTLGFVWASSDGGGTHNARMGRKFQLSIPASTTLTDVAVQFVRLNGAGFAFTHRLKVGNDEYCATDNNIAHVAVNYSGTTITIEVACYINSPAFIESVAIIQFHGTGVPLFKVCDNDPIYPY